MQRKKLSADKMITTLKDCFGEIPDHRMNKKNINFSIGKSHQFRKFDLVFSKSKKIG